MTEITNKSNINFYQFDNVCRFCLKNDFLLKPIFHECSEEDTEVDEWDEYADPNYEYLNIADYVRRLTDLEVEQNDPYPKFLCLACLDVIKTLKEFRDKCTNSFEILKEVKNTHSRRKDSGCDELEETDYGEDMQISDKKLMEGFPEDEWDDQCDPELYRDSEITFERSEGIGPSAGEQQVPQVQTTECKTPEELEQITEELDKTHITQDVRDVDDAEANISAELWRAATVWSKFIVNMDSAAFDDYTEYTIFWDGALTNSANEFSCKIRLIHDDWKKSICECCNSQPAVCEHILAVVLNLGITSVPGEFVPNWNTCCKKL